MTRAQSIYCEKSCLRIRRIFSEAPWANYDLIVSVILCGSGDLFANPEMSSDYNKVYSTLDRSGSPAAGAVFMASGIASFVMVAWPKQPPFVLRLMAGTHGGRVLVVRTNNWGTWSPPVSTVTYSVMQPLPVWRYCERAMGDEPSTLNNL